MEQAKAWQGTTGGGSFGQRAMLGIFRYADVRLGYFIVALTVPFYMLGRRRNAKAIYRYFRQRHGYGRIRSLWSVYRNHCIFGKNLFISLRTSGNNQIQVTTPGKKDHNMGATVPAAGTWWHVALTFQRGASEGCKVYVNGARAGQMTAGAINDVSNATEMWIGKNQWNGENYKGLLDEVRLAAGIRSADWIAAEYAQASGDGFVEFGASGPASTVFFF